MELNGSIFYLHSFLNQPHWAHCWYEFINVVNKRLTKPATNNAALKALLQELKQTALGSRSIDDVITALDNAIAYPNQIKFDNTLYYILGILALLGTLGFGQHVLNLPHRLVTHWDYGILFTFLAGLIASLWVIFSRHSSIKTVSTLIRDEALKHLYNITHSNPALLRRAEQIFTDFQRGNYSQKLEWGKELDFHSELLGLIRVNVVYHHYVDKRVETYTESDGKGGTRTRTRTVYDHYYRQGVIIPAINQVTRLVLSQTRLKKQWHETYMPSSSEFQKQFYVQTDSEFDAAKFLEPTVVLACEQLAKQLDKLTIEFAIDGTLLINQNNTKLLDPAMQFDITEPKKFKQELLNDTSFHTINSILGFVERLIKHTPPHLRKTS